MSDPNNQGASEFSWIAPARPFKRRDREYYITVFAIAAVVGLILFIAEGLMPVVLLVSLVFLYYIMNTVEPGKITHKITEKGIMFGETLNAWSTLQRFWFSKKSDNDLLNLQTTGVPGRLEMVVNPEDIENIKEQIKKHLPEEEVPPTFLDNTTNWIGNKLPNK
jgi:hypothetical protein